MYKQNNYKILSNEKIAKDVYKMILEGDTQYITAPGQLSRASGCLYGCPHC